MSPCAAAGEDTRPPTLTHTEKTPMKKQLTKLLFCATTVLWTHNMPAQRPPNLDREGMRFREFRIWRESLGTMAKCSDVIAIGTVQPGVPWTTYDDWPTLKSYFIFRVDQPIWGCVSNQEFRVQISDPGPSDPIPPPQSRCYRKKRRTIDM